MFAALRELILLLDLPTRIEPLKQQKQGHTLIQNTCQQHLSAPVLAIGIRGKQAKQCGSSNKSYWRSAKTAGIHIALNNDFFADLGLISLRDRWVEIHYQ